MPSHFKVKEYCPIVFRNLRERFGIDDQDYMVGVDFEAELIMVFYIFHAEKAIH